MKLTNEQYEKLALERVELLEQVPVEFRSILSEMAYDRGHSAGEDEVVSILRSLVADLKPAIENFIKNHFK